MCNLENDCLKYKPEGTNTIIDLTPLKGHIYEFDLHSYSYLNKTLVIGNNAPKCEAYSEDEGPAPMKIESMDKELSRFCNYVGNNWENSCRFNNWNGYHSTLFYEGKYDIHRDLKKDLRINIHCDRSEEGFGTIKFDEEVYDEEKSTLEFRVDLYTVYGCPKYIY